MPKKKDHIGHGDAFAYAEAPDHGTRKKKTAAVGPDYPALKSDDAPALKAPDDSIIEDSTARVILTALLGTWDGLPLLENDGYRNGLNDQLDAGERDLRSRYLAGAEEKAVMTFGAIGEARRRRLEGVIGRLQTIIGPHVKAAIIRALDEVGKMAVEAEVNALERRIRTTKANRQRSLTRRVKKMVADSFGNGYRLGRPPRATREEVERRSVEIIRAIEAGPGDKGRVATAYYGDYDFSKAGEQNELERDYQAARRNGSADKLLRRYSKELERQKPAPLGYESLLKRASEKTFGLSLAEWLATGTTGEESHLVSDSPDEGE